MKTLVIIPTFNERDNIATVVAGVRAAAPQVDVLIADDNSPDGTGRIADELAADAHVHVLHRAGKAGLGRAYVAGFEWGLERGYQVLVEMDADLSHRPDQLPRVLKRIRSGADVAIGSRWVPGGAVHNWPFHRQLLSRGANLYAGTLLGLGVRDSTAGFRAYRAEVLRAVHLETVASQGYCFQIDLTVRAVRAGFVVSEVPIDFDERTLGASKMSQHIVVEALTRVTKWGVRHRLDQTAHLLGVGEKA